MSHFGVPEFEYDEIVDGIYVGSNQCCQLHFKEELLNLGVSVDVSLEVEHVDMPFGVEGYLWLPTVDHIAPSDD